jgi:hypothetical protein
VVTYNVKQSIQEIGDFYRKSLNDQGYEVTEFSDEKSVNLMGGDDTHSYVVNVMDNLEGAGGTTVTLTSGSKP